MSGGMQAGGVSKELLTTKGDTHGFSTVNQRVGIGANTQVLTADSTEALGLKWATPTDVAPPTSVKGDLSGFSTSQSRIPIGSNNQILTADSTEALGLKWAAAAGGGKVVLLDDHVASTTENSYTYTPASALNMETTYSKVFVVWSLNECSATSGIRMNLNALASGQNSDGIRFDGTAVTNLSGAGLVGVYLESNVVASVGYAGITEIVYNISGGGHTQTMRCYTRGSGDLGSWRVGTVWQGNLTGSGNTISSIKIDMVSLITDHWVAGSRIMTYGVEL